MEISLSITDRCNARCQMCYIWKKPAQDFSISLIDNLPKSVAKITITGGEPILHPDFERLLLSLADRCPYSRIIILSNGLRPKLLKDKIERIKNNIPKLGVGVSLDALQGEGLRGVENATQRQRKSLLLLKEIGVSDIRVSLAIFDKNRNQLLSVYDWAKKNKIQFLWGLPRNSSFYYRKVDNQLSKEFEQKIKKDVSKLISRQLEEKSVKAWLRAYDSWARLKNLKYNKRTLPCLAGEKFFFISTDGQLYPCELLNKRIGSLKDNSFSSLIKSEEAKRIRSNIKNCQLCWGCAVTDIMIKHSLKVLAWIGKEKIKKKLIA